MAAPAITASTRYYRPGVTKIYFCPTIANILSPTRAELNAGTDISGEVASVSGWQPTRNFLDAPDLGVTFVAKVVAGLEAGDSSINMYASSNSVDARSLLPMDTVGHIVFLYEGDVAGRKMTVFPMRVGSDAHEVDVANVAQLVFQFAITSNPARNVTIPA
jgi:hypothetical protein